MCFGGSSKAQRNMELYKMQIDEIYRQQDKEEQARQYAENERQRLEAQALAEKRYQEQIEREKAIVKEQIDAQEGIAARAIETARKAEEARQQQILQGRSSIDQAFSGFDDNYFNSAAQRYSAAYLPQLEEDRLKSVDKLKAALAGRGTLESTVGVNAFADVEKRAANERAAISSRGSDFAEALRAKVNASKGQMYDANATGADPSGWAARAAGEATNILNLGGIVPAGPAPAYGASYYSPSGGTTFSLPQAQNSSVFGAVLSPLANAANAAFNAPKARTSVASAIAPTTGTGTARVVS